jgi:hypothetical protein
VTIADRSEWKENAKVGFDFVEQLVGRSDGLDDVTGGSSFRRGDLNGDEIHALNGLADSPEPQCLGKLSLNEKRLGHRTSDLPMALDKAVLGLPIWRGSGEPNGMGI